ncbi:MAG: extracellular solute-binding protein [Caldilineaceae bacterium]|nr:extracellular solute-binding protein [Caldilineaceae bacterium]MCB0142263.1 extracellular solute-binding protein [Caldilineaceae bacterium]
MNYSRRQFLKFSSYAMTGIALAACSPSSPAPESASQADAAAAGEAEAQPAAERISMVYHSWTAEPEGNGEKIGVANFAEANPDIDIEHRVTPFDDYWKALLTDAGIGEPPDAYLMNNFNWQLYIDAGMGIDLLPSAAILDTPGTNVDDYIPSVLEGCKREGKLYGFPKAINGSAFIINKSMFDEKGVALPPDDADWTYADFEEAAAAMTDEEAKIFGCEVTTGHAWIPTFLFTLGGRYLDPDEHRYADGWLNSEANAEWVNWIKKLTDSGLKPSPGGLDAFGGMTGGMLGGNIAITHTDGFQQVAQAVREDTPYEWSGARTPIPAADVELKPHIALHGVMVPQGVKDVLKAVELAGYVTYGATTDMDRPSKMSTRKDFAEKQALTDYPHFRALYDQVFANNVQLHEGALITHVDILGEEWNQMIERVLLDGMDTMESLNVAAENYDKRVAEKEA